MIFYVGLTIGPFLTKPAVGNNSNSAKSQAYRAFAVPVVELFSVILHPIQF